VANGRGFNQFKIIDQADRLTRSPERIPQDEDIQAANELYKEMFGYDIATGRFKEVLGPTRSGAPISPIDILKRYKDMNRNVFELHMGDRPQEGLYGRDVFRESFGEPLYDWGSIGAGVSKILDKKQRDQIFSEVVEAEQEGTRVEIGDVPKPEKYPRAPYKASYKGLDPKKDRKKIERRALLEHFINVLRDEEKDEGLPMRTKSLQEWMFNR